VVPADPQALAAALRAVLAGEDRSGRERGAQVALRYDSARLAERVLTLYASLQERRRPAAASA
ncbi:MAG: hypothetical protein WAJ85_06905, partial [Candidatus Baltobacteraceae bacterium]